MKFRHLALAVLTSTLAFGAQADPAWGYGSPYHRHATPVQYIVEQPVIYAPPVIYQTAPQVIYRDRIVYRDRPVVYETPAPTGYYNGYPAQGDNRAAAQMIGAVTGGVIGNHFGQGNGRTAATALGAVIGSVVGGRISGGY